MKMFCVFFFLLCFVGESNEHGSCGSEEQNTAETESRHTQKILNMCRQ